MTRLLRNALRTSMVALTVSAVVASTQTAANNQIKTYRDAQHGVSFQYPMPWVSDPEMGFYLPAQILLPDRKPLAAVGFGGSQKSKYHPYPKTNLSGVQFVYVVLPEATAEQCQHETKGEEESDKETQETIHGVSYRHLSSGGAGLCHQAEDQIYAAYRGGRCYLFDAAIDTVCPDPDDGRREITPAEINTLRNQLKQIMQSVRIGSDRN